MSRTEPNAAVQARQDHVRQPYHTEKSRDEYTQLRYRRGVVSLAVEGRGDHVRPELLRISQELSCLACGVSIRAWRVLRSTKYSYGPVSHIAPPTPLSFIRRKSTIAKGDLVWCNHLEAV